MWAGVVKGGTRFSRTFGLLASVFALCVSLPIRRSATV